MFENYDFTKLFMLAGLAAVTWLAMKLNQFVFSQIRRKRKNGLKMKFFERLFSVLILITAIVFAFSIFGGFKTVWRTLLGGTAILSAVLAYTGQDIIKDILAGFMISMYKPFEIGNRIELENGTVGIVKDITMRHVVLQLLDTKVCVIPNSKLNAMSLMNYSYHSENRSKLFTFHIAYDSDVRKAMKVIREAIIASSYSVPGKKRDYGMDYGPVYFMSFEASSLMLQTTVWYPPEVPTELMISDINLRVDLALSEAGIEIPYQFVNVVNRVMGEKQGTEELVRSGRPYSTEDIVITADGEGMKEAIEKTEKFARACGLQKKEVLRLRLLCEEALGMIRGILQNSDASYHISRSNNTYYLHLKSGINTDNIQRKQLLSVSSSGLNAAPMGLMDRISCMIRTSQHERMSPAHSLMMNLGMNSGEESEGLLASWSLQQYREALKDHKESDTEAAEAWDELERSIVASIADDISVRITRSAVDMTITKKF